MPLIDYNRLYSFIKVAEFGSVSAAARALGRTQSAVTQQIQGLESDLGLKLFERRHARIFLSPDGQRIYDGASLGFGGVEDVVQQVCADARSLKGRIRIGALNDQSTGFDPVDLVCNFRKKFPLVEIALSFGTNERIEDLILAGEVELGFAIVFKQKDQFERTEIARETHMLVASAQLLEGREPIRHYEDILEFPLIDLSDDFICLAPWFQKNKPQVEGSLRRLRPSLVFADHAAARKAMMAGLGLCISPQHLLVDDLASGKACQIMSSAKNLRVGLDVAYRKSRPLRLVEKEFLSFAAQAKMT